MASSLKKLIAEIHRRSVWQVLGAYLVGSWIAYQVVWNRVFPLVIGSFTYSFSLIVTACLTGMGLGYLLNFSEDLMKDGITRTVNQLIEEDQ